MTSLLFHISIVCHVYIYKCVNVSMEMKIFSLSLSLSIVLKLSPPVIFSYSPLLLLTTLCLYTIHT